jgi:hypothetical protein
LVRIEWLRRISRCGATTRGNQHAGNQQCNSDVHDDFFLGVDQLT